MDIIAWTIVILSAVAVWGVLFPLRRYLLRSHLVDVPNQRSLHANPTPRGGGVVIVVLVLLAWTTYALFYDAEGRQAIAAYVLGAVLIASVSGWDDLRSLSNRIRLTTHFLGALVAVVGLGYLSTLVVPSFGSVTLAWLGAPFTVLWIVGLTNAYNFMDGIDGIAASQAVSAGIGWAVLGWLGEAPLITLLGLVLAGSCIGFLWHNWSPARMFMGDVGSAFLGYTFALLPLLFGALAPDPDKGSRCFACGLMMLWPFVFDTGFTLLRRLRRGENIFAAHRSHLYQRLVLAGFSHRFVTSLYAALAGIGLALGLAWVSGVRGSEAALLATLPLLCLALWGFVVYQERWQPAGAPVKTK